MMLVLLWVLLVVPPLVGYALVVAGSNDPDPRGFVGLSVGIWLILAWVLFLPVLITSLQA